MSSRLRRRRGHPSGLRGLARPADPLVARHGAVSPLRRIRSLGPSPRRLRRRYPPRRGQAGGSDLCHLKKGADADELGFLRDLTPLLGSHGRLAMATVVSAVGSTPRETTARMLVLPDGSTQGRSAAGSSSPSSSRTPASSSTPRPSFHREYSFVPTGENCLRGRLRRDGDGAARDRGEGPAPPRRRRGPLRARAGARRGVHRIRGDGRRREVRAARPGGVPVRDPARPREGRLLRPARPAPGGLRGHRLARPRDGRSRVPAAPRRPGRVSRHDRQQGQAEGPLRRAARRGLHRGRAESRAQPDRPRDRRRIARRNRHRHRRRADCDPAQAQGASTLPRAEIRSARIPGKRRHA